MHNLLDNGYTYFITVENWKAPPKFFWSLLKVLSLSKSSILEVSGYGSYKFEKF